MRGGGTGHTPFSAAERFPDLRVDVNEQNERAVRFYERSGFSLINRSAVDEQGDPYPTLHLYGCFSRSAVDLSEFAGKYGL